MSWIGACDASASGMGGVWFAASDTIPPLVWRHRFTRDITQRVLSTSNPTGDITNSDLELLAVAAQHDVLSCTAPHLVQHRNLAILSDNTPAVAWALRGSVTGDSPSAYLLRLLALHRRHYRYTSLLAHIPGQHNTMADDCSRLWELADTDLLSHFASTYPQTQSWQLCQLPSATASALISALSKTRSKPEWWLAQLNATAVPGKFGSSSVPPSTWTLGSFPSNPRSPFFRFLPSASAPANCPSAGLQYAHALQRRMSGLSARRSPAWASQIHA